MPKPGPANEPGGVFPVSFFPPFPLREQEDGAFLGAGPGASQGRAVARRNALPLTGKTRTAHHNQGRQGKGEALLRWRSGGLAQVL